ncbi:hypothetical protein RHO14_02380 [Orbus wheelerorum]|uniref:hypothetical protein n=1 Tax=Orbus wheelerorum TaxID=3074111 RepID=UPI00370D405C
MIEKQIEYLKKRKANISCNGKTGILFFLESIGFSITNGKSEQHKIFSFKELSMVTNGEFKTFSIDCGHYPNRPMKKNYIINIIRLLEKYEVYLLELNRDE